MYPHCEERRLLTPISTATQQNFVFRGKSDVIKEIVHSLKTHKNAIYMSVTQFIYAGCFSCHDCLFAHINTTSHIQDKRYDYYDKTTTITSNY